MVFSWNAALSRQWSLYLCCTLALMWWRYVKHCCVSIFLATRANCARTCGSRARSWPRNRMAMLIWSISVVVHVLQKSIVLLQYRRVIIWHHLWDTQGAESASVWNEIPFIYQLSVWLHHCMVWMRHVQGVVYRYLWALIRYTGSLLQGCGKPPPKKAIFTLIIYCLASTSFDPTRTRT